MPEPHPDSPAFETLARELLSQGLSVRFEARGASMSPVIRDQEMVIVTPVIVSKLRKGDIVLTKGHSGLRVHRLVFVDHRENLFITRGDCGQQDDPPVHSGQILGVVLAKEVRLGKKIVQANFNGFRGKLLQGAARGQYLAGKLLRKAGILGSQGGKMNLLLSALFLLVLTASSSYAQQAVAVDSDPSTDTSADLTGSGTKTLTFTHSTSTTANRALLVGVSMDITNSTATAVTGITYNGVALTLAGAQNDASNTRRVEQWYLLNPASGTNLSIVVSVNIPAAATVGVTAGATVFTDVDQTVPLGAFTPASGEVAGCIASSATGNYQCSSGVTVPSVVNGMVFDTLAVGYGTVTTEGPQTQQWNVTSGTPNASEDVVGTASSRTGAPSVPVAEYFNNALALTSVVPNTTQFSLTSVAPSTVTFNLTSVATSNGTSAVYTGTITGGANNAFVGDTVVVKGFSIGINNGTFTCTASTATTLTLSNKFTFAQTGTATAAANTTVYAGTITGGAANAYIGDAVVTSGFVNAANNGSFVVVASTATALTVNNFVGVAETDPGTAYVSTGSGGNALYVGTITGGASNGYAGDSFTIAGFGTAGNNGTFTCTASTATTLTCPNSGAASQTGAATATTNSTFNWAQAGISVNPSVADIGVTTGVGSAVFVGANTQYTITVSNHGTSAANSVVLTDTWSTTNLTTISITPSSGTTCSATPPITCTLPTPFASGATATVVVTVKASVSGSYANTASVTDSGTPPDPNSGNNQFTAVATVQSAACANVGQAKPASAPLTGVLNSYYPGKASVVAGVTSITLGTATGGASGTPTAIATGNLLLVIQMQDASITTSDTVTYGNGSTGQGFSLLNNAGNFEYVTATNAVPATGGTLSLTGAGGGGGLVFGYDATAATGTKGQSTFQVILVPQYTTATLGTTGLTAPAWNGSTGGVLALDTSSTLTLNGATVAMDGLGFRGGAGLQMSGPPTTAPPILPTSSDFLQPAPATYTAAGTTGNGQAGWDGSKGEGVAGTPAWLEESVSGTLEPVSTGTGYPSGSYGQFNLTSVAAGNGTTTVYTGTLTGGAGNAWAGYTFVVGGFSTAANNGRFTSTASTATTLTLSNTSGVAQTGTATANLDGSMARGAPANAGGGGTDADPANATPNGNDENSGGGGGGNGGPGGFGGDSWSANLSDGGEGGASFPSTVNRVAMGGGGGAGTRNNSNGDSQATSGSAGGGIIIIRAYALSGNATLTSNGANAYNNTLNDGGGGAGAGGSLVVLSANGGESGLTFGANGGVGGDAWGINPFTLGDRHGAGGGGGGGMVIVSGTPASLSVSGGASGTTEDPGVSYGATSGTGGSSVTNASITQTSGTQSGADCTPDMTILKSSSGVFTRGTSTTYTLTANNISPYGPTSATVTVNDTLPVGLTPTSASGTGWSCSLASQTVSCTDTSVLAGASSYATISVGANVLQTAPSTETNTGIVGGGGEINLTNDTSTNVATVVSTAALSLTNVATPDPVAAGANATFTQVLTNSGPSAADNATLVQAVPANSTFVSMTAPSGWSCTVPPVGGTGNVVCTALSMTGGTAATFSMVAKVNTGVANGTVISDTATASSSVNDPNTTNNTATAATVVGGSTTAEMTLTNVASPNPVVAGSDITYTQTATNIGTGLANTPTLTENTPANTTFVSISTPTGTTCTTPAVGGTGAISCTAAAAPAGSSGTIVVVVQVNSGTAAGTVITDTATVNSSNQAYGAYTAVATDVVASSSTQADVALSTVATPLTVYPGNDVTYIQSVSNNGPGTASNLTFTEAVPTNTTFASISPPAGWTCTTPAVGATGTISCVSASMASGSSANIEVVVNVAATITAASITANSSVSSTTSDPNTANNSTTTVTPVLPVCDLAVTNTGTPNPATAGQNIVYTQVVTNSGPSNCAGGTFTEAIPANTTFVSMPTPAGWTCTTTGPISCTESTIAPGASSTFTATMLVSGTAAAGTLITDQATVGTTTHDSNTANNTAISTIAVAGATQADLSVTSSASPNPVAAGSNITYTQTATNAGPAAASTVTFTETLPANTTAVSLTGPSGWTCTLASLTCTTTSFAANTTANFSYVVAVSGTTASGTVINQTDSIASSVTGDPNSGNNSAPTTVYVSPSANLSITNVDSPVPVQAGNAITYTQVVTNSGPSSAAGTTLTETTPANTTFGSITVPSGWSCTTPAAGGTGTISCTDASLGVTSSSFSIVLNVPTGTAAGTAISNTATVTTTTNDPNLANNTATANDVVATSTQADLVVTNTASPTSVAAGSNVTYTQTVTNDGPAAATTVSFTQTTPPNTNFQSITAPTGWTCTNPGVGNAGTITCTASTLALNATASFSLVLQVNSSTVSGTNIAETDTATASNIVPNLTGNSATALISVPNANSTNVTIGKTATPSPNVPSGDTLVYTLTITNTGTASATNVTVTDPLPSDVTYLGNTTTQGTCSPANGTVTCLLGTMAGSATATISIITLAGAPGIATNTASVTADQMTTPNTATQIETITFATSVKLASFMAHPGKAGSMVLVWKTGGEAHNLGFNVYREENGDRVQINPSLIAGSALLMSGALPKHSGKTYMWIDSSPAAATSQYWLEDVDINGTRTLHGPITAGSPAASESSTGSNEETPMANATLLNQLNQAAQPKSIEPSHRAENISHILAATPAQYQKQFEIAGHPAVKIFVKHEGWYQVTQPELVNAGLDPNVDPALLHLYNEAIEQPIQISGTTAGPGGFGPQATIGFYGTGIDTPYTGTRAYFLTAEETPGQRIQTAPPSTGSNQPPTSFPYTVELTPHTTYFSALITTNGNNFFGPLISTTPTEETMKIPDLDENAASQPQLEIILQGVILGAPHDVTVVLNGTTLGDVTYSGEGKGKLTVTIPPGVLLSGVNTVTMTSQDGEYDYSVLQTIHITYPHLYTADSDELIFTGRAGDELTISGFKQAAVAVFDITNADQPVQLPAQIAQASGTNGGYIAQVQVPWSTAGTAALHTLMAVAADRVAPAAAIRRNHPTHWHQAQPGSEIVMISAPAFANSLHPIIEAHKAEGESSAVALVDDLYDEFNFGEHSPVAIRSFLQAAVKAWQTTPKYLLLNGRASLDPRNYLGFGLLDYVPTKIIPTPTLMTASDDWFSDFKDTGLPAIATGRLPVSTEAEAELVVGKIATYEGQTTNGPWTSQALMVADVNDTENFTKDSQVVQAQLPHSIQVTDVFATTMGIPEAQQAILSGINSGQLLVNYAGHGSEDMWSGDDLFDNNAANSLTNGNSLPVFLIMDCLNGFFQDVYDESLAVTLMLAPGGGSVAVLASSGLNSATPQTILDKLVVQSAIGSSHRDTLGDAIVKAKSGITDMSVRKTYNLLGDPAMQVKLPGAPVN
jgi:uncharacterized repeat protein (TIGR01451 family)